MISSKFAKIQTAKARCANIRGAIAITMGGFALATGVGSVMHALTLPLAVSIVARHTTGVLASMRMPRKQRLFVIPRLLLIDESAFLPPAIFCYGEELDAVLAMPFLRFAFAAAVIFFTCSSWSGVSTASTFEFRSFLSATACRSSSLIRAS